MKYKLLLFDADGTLLNYNKAEEYSLKSTLDFFNCKYDEKSYLNSYRQIDCEVWNDYQNNIITEKEIPFERLKIFFSEINVSQDPKEFYKKYLSFFSQSNFLQKNAETLISQLHKKYKLAIVTNGISNVQFPRIKNSLIGKYFNEIIVSEDAGYSKPDINFFDYAFNKTGHTDKSSVLIIGDSLESDIQGGINYNIDTCWYNPENTTPNIELDPTYIINNLLDLEKLL